MRSISTAISFALELSSQQGLIDAALDVLAMFAPAAEAKAGTGGKL
jgi:hypothetical protein